MKDKIRKKRKSKKQRTKINTIISDNFCFTNSKL